MIDESTEYDLIVIGAGAAGLMAAVSAGRCGTRVLLLEKNRKLGVKILMSGGTRCNITHACDSREMVAAFGRNGRFLHSPLAALSPDDVIDLIEGQGVATKVESTGKVFPVSDRAIDVRDALVRLATESGAEIVTGCGVTGVTFRDDRFVLESPRHTFICKNLLITTGGKSYPGCGTTGDGYGWAESFGHTIVETMPALTPILIGVPWANALKGLTVADVDLSIVELAPGEHEPASATRSKPLARNRNSFLFTHFGFSGPAALNVSNVVSGHTDRTRLRILCDWLPSLGEDEIVRLLESAAKTNGKQIVLNLIANHLQRRLAEALLKAAGIDPRTRNAELSRQQRAKLIRQLKHCSFPTTGTLGFEKAEVTSGGVALDEVDSRTMQSKLQRGLYFAGEVLDLDGPIGGYNFQAAFSTGWLAGQSV